MPNDNIMGIETKACINGVTKSDVERLKNALVKRILDDETVIDITKDGKIIVANDDGFFLSFNDSVIGLTKDSDDNIIPITDPYIPMDENDNPLTPANNVIMTSANIAVDPRIVHTIGNEKIAGEKIFINGIDTNFINWHMTYMTGIMEINQYSIFAEVTLINNPGRFIILDFIQSSNTMPCYGRLMIQCLSNPPDSTPKPLWLYRKAWGIYNNPLSSTSIVLLHKDNHLYIAWKKEHTYGSVRCRVSQDMNYGNVPSKPAPIIFFEPEDMLILSNLDDYTVYQVTE